MKLIFDKLLNQNINVIHYENVQNLGIEMLKVVKSKNHGVPN